MYQQQVGQNLVGFGKADPTGKCEVCRENTEAGSYGLGGSARAMDHPDDELRWDRGDIGYLPSDELTISVATTYEADAFDPRVRMPTPVRTSSPRSPLPLPRIMRCPSPRDEGWAMGWPPASIGKVVAVGVSAGCWPAYSAWAAGS